MTDKHLAIIGGSCLTITLIDLLGGTTGNAIGLLIFGGILGVILGYLAGAAANDHERHLPW